MTQTSDTCVGPLRIAIITAEDPFYINQFFKEFFRMLPDSSIEVIGLVNLKPFNLGSKTALARKMLRFYGFFNFIRMQFRYLSAKLFKTGLDQMAEANGINVLRTKNINSKSFLRKLADLNPDVVVSVSASQIFRSRLLELPRLGCWNVHGGRLPRYRGMMPAFWTLFNGEREGAITVHKMNARLDDGDILYQHVYPVEPGESLDHLVSRSKILGAGVLLKALDMLTRRDWKLLPNDADQATYYSFPTPQEVKLFKDKKLKLL